MGRELMLRESEIALAPIDLDEDRSIARVKAYTFLFTPPLYVEGARQLTADEEFELIDVFEMRGCPELVQSPPQVGEYAPCWQWDGLSATGAHCCRRGGHSGRHIALAHNQRMSRFIVLRIWR